MNDKHFNIALCVAAVLCLVTVGLDVFYWRP